MAVLTTASAQYFRPAPADPVELGFGQADAMISKIPGLRLENVTFFQGYSSNGLSRLGGVPASASRLGPDFDYGGSLTLAWRKPGPRTSMSFIYTPSHISRSQYSEWNSTDHDLSLNIDRKLSRRWNLGISSSAAVQGMEQFFYHPPVFRRVESPPGTVDDLIEAARSGGLTNDELASVITGAPVVEKPGRGELDLGRVFTSSASAKVSFQYSPRLTWHAGMSAYRYHSFTGPRSDNAISQRLFLQSTTSVVGETGVSYRLSPRTKVGFDFSAQRSESQFQNASYLRSLASVTRKVGRRWTVGAHGGVASIHGLERFGQFQPLDNETSFGAKPRWVVGGDLGFQGRAHSFDVSVSQDVGDVYGFGAQTSLMFRSSYKWFRPGSAWGFTAGTELYRMDVDNPQLFNTESRVFRAGIIRQVGPQTSLQTEYIFGSYLSPFTGVYPNLSRHRVQVSLIWRPTELPR